MDEKQWQDKKWMFEIERLESSIELDSRAGKSFYSIMIPLSAGIFGGFLAFYTQFSRIELPYIYFSMAIASICPLIIAQRVQCRFNVAIYRRINRLYEIESRLKIKNRRLFIRFKGIRVRYYFSAFIILFIIAWVVIGIGIFCP